MGKEVKVAVCHPERQHKAKGLCSRCYNKEYKKLNPEATSAYHQGYRSERRELLQSTEQARRDADPSKHRSYFYKRQYGMTLDDVRQMLEDQGFACAICQRELNEDTKHVDHCHKTGYVRGLLCARCNLGLGKLGDNIEGLKKALAYLEKKPSEFKA